MSDVSQPNIIEKIEKSLEAATPGPLAAKDDLWPGNSNLQYWVETMEDGIGAFATREDAYLSANAPEWLRALLEENKRLKVEKETCLETITAHLTERTQMWKEREEVKESRDKWEQAYNRKTFTLINAEAEIWNLHDQLSAQKKVLEWYADKTNYLVPDDHVRSEASCDEGVQARTILSQYTNRTDTEGESKNE